MIRPRTYGQLEAAHLLQEQKPQAKSIPKCIIRDNGGYCCKADIKQDYKKHPLGVTLLYSTGHLGYELEKWLQHTLLGLTTPFEVTLHHGVLTPLVGDTWVL